MGKLTTDKPKVEIEKQSITMIYGKLTRLNRGRKLLGNGLIFMHDIKTERAIMIYV